MNTLHKHTKKPLIISLFIVAALVLASVGYVVYAKQTDKWPFASTETTTSTDESDSTNDATNTPDSDTTNTNDSTYESDKNSDTPTDQDTPTTSNGKKTVNVSIASADLIGDSIEVRANTDSVIEGTGTCSATLKRNNGSAETKTSEAFVNATSTQCRPITFDRLGATSWNVTVEYSSPTSTGTSSLEGKA